MKKVVLIVLLAHFCLIFSLKAQSPFTAPDSLLVIQEGIASYYGTRFHNRRTANGEIYDMWQFTAAHKHLPFGTLLKVTNKKNGSQAVVRINDRLPKSSKRIIDLSKGVAEHLDMVNDGIVPVTLELLSHHAIDWVKQQYQLVPSDIRLRSYFHDIAYTKDEEIIKSTLKESLQKK
ncbi:septal ring lytic transglycosylase RlpA family protein [Cyclobacterium jeungdonense]|uniref:Probable endolytic peptidoglycan transglycosylase RlpA n=1 Tax=Cyclobacterium jeungdonense TaxID=708087 RepID=A0ABT8C5N3_9BACT|nr:septal ring lytic transglycosylase RlpA family protein [Cyclobacterium jeungdonense]MDN3688103.1 septal ring lytic transglycosylase RlpA family protein [Cyclobacterium jeungdonense]